MVLDQEQLDFFSVNGYLCYGALLKPEEVEELRKAYDETFLRAEERGGARNLSDPDAGSGARKKMFQIMQMCERHLAFRKLIYDGRILDIVEDLIGPNLMLFHDQALFKPAHTGGAVFWHQDNSYWKCAPANLVSCWLTLDDVVADNGAMQVIPGSHLRPVHHELSESKALQEIKGVDFSQATVVDLPAGGVMFHHCQTLHYTAPNTTERQRRAFAIHFMPVGTKDKEGNTMRVSYAHPMLRMRI